MDTVLSWAKIEMKYPLAVSDRGNTPPLEELYDIQGQPLTERSGVVINFNDVRETDRTICVFTGEDRNVFLKNWRFSILPEGC